MQTFLPYPSYIMSAQALDSKRLGKQRVECIQILNALEGRSTGWRNHPATKMWEEHIDSLKHYTNSILLEWLRRGYNNTIPLFQFIKSDRAPYWLGDVSFHRSHQSNLLRKDLIHYSEFKWKVTTDLPYVWPESPRTYKDHHD